MLSYPHFYTGSSKLYEYLDGLHPTEEDHASYLDFHTQTGVMAHGRSRLQMNIWLTGDDAEPNIKNDIILPLFWVEEHLDDLPEDVKKTLYMFEIITTKLFDFLRYASLLCAFLCVLIILYSILNYERKTQQNQKDRDVNLNLLSTKKPSR